MIDCHEVTLIQLGRDIVFTLSGVKFPYVLDINVM